ncbi:SigE family RNA polymerase sigma factor [Iamia sp. SCSIO 61187]|uniref:SigE family RNA polymerase sigma factor n=1 Tax=Iamia sp. SCSIO 61187 TaxID=2722752 RepID=UPI001C62DFB5|nr:SigE family RNA polymerase sigma factor [Iamia sp. SCSIO 61187]QYG94535.1 SigE family RNA polymerase sigma factor [Iamia sp. SCSIO 61187]
MSEISATPSSSASGPARPADLAPDLAGLFADHHHRLLRVAFLLSGDDRTAEDLVADAFAKAYRHLVRGRVDDPGAYLRRAVVNGWKRQLGRRIRDRERARHLRVGWDPTFEDATAERERILAALAPLPARQRAVVVLRFLDDLSEADTAAVLGISPGSVKTHSHRALARLRTTLEEDT